MVAARPISSTKAEFHVRRFCPRFSGIGTIVLVWKTARQQSDNQCQHLWERQLLKLVGAVREKRPKPLSVTFLQDNARPDTLQSRRHIFKKPGWITAEHRPCSRDTRSTGLRSFPRPEAASAREKKKRRSQLAQGDLTDFFGCQSHYFWDKGMSLPSKWFYISDHDCDGTVE
ncbi:hypothetical protein KIN20_022668 [Parelaphostrongylus tenuis]|uniref:Uncharacterized protein n=1 Tax=Parelaphostrongylus tenuis TaxID=148309 RepID=A0AAD5MQH8_PARTN|nr:hypothetical protein KIN20_022668 [Parelaphostrongylus tenuis]